MAAGIFNIAKGRIARYSDLTGGSDELVAVLIQSGQETDATLRDYETLAGLLAGANSEATFTGYIAGGKTLTGVVVTTDQAADEVTVDCDDVAWSPTSAQALGKIVICYDPDGTNTASSMIPLFHDDFVVTTPTSGSVTYEVATGGFVTSS